MLHTCPRLALFSPLGLDLADLKPLLPSSSFWLFSSSQLLLPIQPLGDPPCSLRAEPLFACFPPAQQVGVWLGCDGALSELGAPALLNPLRTWSPFPAGKLQAKSPGTSQVLVTDSSAGGAAPGGGAGKGGGWWVAPCRGHLSLGPRRSSPLGSLLPCERRGLGDPL